MNELFFFVALTSGIHGMPQPTVNWHTDYGVALREARREQRPLLVLIDRPSKDQQKATPIRLDFNRSAVELLQHYLICRIDTSTTYGRKVAKAFRAEELPYLSIIDKTGRSILFQRAGTLTADHFRSVLLTYRRGEKPVRRIHSATHPATSQGSQSSCFT